MHPVFMVGAYKEYANTEVRKLSSDEVKKYLAERVEIQRRSVGNATGSGKIQFEYDGCGISERRGNDVCAVR